MRGKSTGRRKKTPAELGYKSAWCARVLEIMREGQGFNTVCAEFGICRTTMLTVAERVPEFAAALETGRAAYYSWWEEQGRINLNNKSFQSVLWIFNMKNRCLWRDAIEQRRDINVTVKAETIEETNNLIRAALKPHHAADTPTKH